ncbi:MAG: hypothetical protein AB1531_05060 [Chloroflexota bacterium]
MSLFDFVKKKNEPEKPTRPKTKQVVHRAKTVHQPLEAEGSPEVQTEAEQTAPVKGDSKGRQHKDIDHLTEKFKTILAAAKKELPAKLPRKYLVRTAAWDLSAGISLFVNAVLLGVVLLLAIKINTLQNTLNGLLGGLYDNFVRMDESYITTTIAVEDVPVSLDFILAVVQTETNVTLTRDVVIRNAIVGVLSAPTTVTLPAGTVLPVSLNMNVPVQTTVLVDLQVPVNIELASANSTDPAIANLHTAFLGLQDTIGPLYCLLQPAAVDYLSQPLCNEKGVYISRASTIP